MSFTDLQKTYDWFKEAYSFNRTSKNLHTQIGVHFEEVAEMLETIEGNDPTTKKLISRALLANKALANYLKASDHAITIQNRIEFLDALCDQIVTATGCGYHAYMNVVDAFAEVNRSNFSKFDENGKAILDQNLKVAKGTNYRRADLTPFV